MALGKVNCMGRGKNPMILIPTPSQDGTLTYNGTEQTPTWLNYHPAQIAMTGETSATDGGTHNVFCTPQGICYWDDSGVQDTRLVQWSIGQATQTISASYTTPIPFGFTVSIPVADAGGRELSATSSDSTVIAVQGCTNTAVLVKALKLSNVPVDIIIFAAANNNYFSAQTSCSVSTEIAVVDVPAVTNLTFTQDGNPHAPTIAAFNSDVITVTGNEPQSVFGNYTITFALADKTASQWSDGTTTDKSVAWEILFDEGAFNATTDMLVSSTIRFGTDTFYFEEDDEE